MNAYFSIGTTTPIAEIKTALQTQYGSENVTVHYESTAYLIFSCTYISEKVIKILWSTTIRCYYGDAYSSGATITNEVQFLGYPTGTASVIHLVLGDSFFYLVFLSSSTNSGVAIIAKLTNNNYVCVGFLGSSSYAIYTRGRDTTDSEDIVISTLDKGFVNSLSKLYKQPLIFVKASGIIEETSGGELATISGLYNVSYTTGSAAVLVKGTNYLMSPCRLYMSDSQTYVNTCLFAEW